MYCKCAINYCYTKIFSKLLKSRKVSNKIPKSQKQKLSYSAKSLQSNNPPHPYSFNFKDIGVNLEDYKSPPPSPIPMYESSATTSRRLFLLEEYNQHQQELQHQ